MRMSKFLGTVVANKIRRLDFQSDYNSETAHLMNFQTAVPTKISEGKMG